VLEARDDDGIIGSTGKTIEVLNAEPVSILGPVEINGETAQIIDGSISVVEDDMILISAEKSSDTSSDIDYLEHSWLLNGRKISGNQMLLIRFHSKGVHTLSHEVIDDDGDSSRTDLEVVVRNLPPVAYAGEDMVLFTNIAEFNGSSSSDTPSDFINLTFEWDLGDGIVKNGRSVIHEFREKGTYMVRLSISDDDGEVATDTLTVTIRNLVPDVDVVYPLEVNEDLIFSLDARGSKDPDGFIEYFSWTFSDGTRKEGAMIEHVFHRSGKERIILEVADDNNGIKRREMEVTVLNLAPIAEAGDDNESVIGRPMDFDGSSSNDTVSDRKNLTYVWRFPGNITKEGIITEHTFITEGTFKVVLEVIDPEGLRSLDEISVWIWGSVLESIDIDLEIEPEKCGPGENILVKGKVTYHFSEKIPDRGINIARVKVRLQEMILYTIPDSNGNFQVTLISPEEEGEYSVICSLTRLGKTEESIVEFRVEKTDGRAGMMEITTSPVAITTATGIILIGAGSGVLLSTDIGRWKFFLLLVPLYSRLKRDEVLDNFERGRIYQYIMMNPGDYYSNIKKMLDMNNGTLTYHLKVLEQKEFIRSRTEGKLKRFYPYGMKVQQGSHRDIQDLILETIYIHPGISQKEIASILGIHVSTVNYHVNMMVGAGILGSESKDRVQRYHAMHIGIEIPIY
jgi:DNA-binding MarR family transcriptional regulator/PKD repeat protein